MKNFIHRLVLAGLLVQMTVVVVSPTQTHAAAIRKVFEEPNKTQIEKAIEENAVLGPIAVSWSPISTAMGPRRVKLFDSSNGNPFKVANNRHIVAAKPTREALLEAMDGAFSLANSDLSEPGTEKTAKLFFYFNAHGHGQYMVDKDSNPFFYRDLVDYLYRQITNLLSGHPHQKIEVTLFIEACFGFPMHLIRDKFTATHDPRIKVQVWVASDAEHPGISYVFDEVLTSLMFFRDLLPDEIRQKFSLNPSTFIAFSGENYHDFYDSESGLAPVFREVLPLESLKNILRGNNIEESTMAIRILGSASEDQALPASKILLDYLQEVLNFDPSRMAFNATELSKLFQSREIIENLRKLSIRNPETLSSSELIQSIQKSPVGSFTNMVNSLYQILIKFRVSLLGSEPNYQINNQANNPKEPKLASGSKDLEAAYSYLIAFHNRFYDDFNSYGLVVPYISENLIKYIQNQILAASENDAIILLGILGESKNSRATEFLARMAEESYSELIREQAIRSLGKTANPEAFSAIKRIALSEDTAISIRDTAIRALTNFYTPEVIGLLQNLLRSDRSEIQDAAKAVLKFFDNSWMKKTWPSAIKDEL